MSKKRSNSDGARRRFLAEVLGLAGGSSLFGLGAVLYTRQVASMPVGALRPPGALAEDDFVPGWFATGDGVPALLEQTHGTLRVEVVPGRSSAGLARYQHLVGRS